MILPKTVTICVSNYFSRLEFKCNFIVGLSFIVQGRLKVFSYEELHYSSGTFQECLFKILSYENFLEALLPNDLNVI